MKVYDEKHIKNIVLLGSAKSGKTTMAETMLYEAGLIDRRGSVEGRNTVSDYHEVEKERGNSVYATSMHTEWRNYKINIIDTPGFDDFIGEVVSSVRVADTCTMLINAQHGVEVGTELTFDYIERFQKPMILAINQVDHGKADFFSAVDSAREAMGGAVTLVQYPLNQGDGFNAIIDLLKMRMYEFPPEGGKPAKHPIPSSEIDRANELHNALVEKAAENDEQLMELYFEKGNLTEDELRKGLKIGMMNHDVFPVFCISAKNDMGTGRLMGFIDNVAPSAGELYEEPTADGKTVAYDPEAPTSIFVFKSLVEPFIGKINFFKVITGELKVGDELENAQTGNVERFAQLFIMDGKNRNTVEKLVAGDIGATVKLKDAATNHTLREKGTDYEYASMAFPEPRIRVAVEAASKKQEDKLAEVMRDLQEEDPTLHIDYAKELRQLILTAQGEMHLAVTKWKLETLNDIEVTFLDPKVPYRETIQRKATANYRHKKQSGGAGQFAEVTLSILPYEEGMPDPEGFNIRGKEVVDLEWGGKLVFYNCIVGGVIDARFIPSILKGVMENMANAPITGSYARDICVLVHDGKMHTVDSNDVSFKIAGNKAFKEAFLNASPKLLEPYYDLKVFTPEELVGEVMTDLQSRRALIMGIDAKERYQVVEAKVPLAEIDRYTSTLKSLSQGRATFRLSFRDYEPVPHDLQEKLLNEHNVEQE